jgi:hypothetical protein
MTSQDDVTRAADRLTDALGAAADVMTVPDSPVLPPVPRARRPGGWLLPLAAAASVVVIALAAVALSHLGRGSAAPGTPANGTPANGTPANDTPAGGAPAAPPQFYMTLGLTSSTAMLEVRRTADGALTASMASPVNMLQGGYLTAAASDRVFFVGGATKCGTAPTVSRFYRITITGSGRISDVTKVGSPLRGMVDDMAVSPDGSRMAYTLAPSPRCQNPVNTQPRDVVRIMDLATGAVRTWQNTSTTPGPARVAVVTGGLSWTPDGRTLVVDYYWTTLFENGPALAVLGLDAASDGGSLQAHSRPLWHQDPSCVSCVTDVIAGPGGSLTAAEEQSLGTRRTQLLVVRMAAGPVQATRTVLYREVSPTPEQDDAIPVVFADPSGRSVITWPLTDTASPSWQANRAGWISVGEDHGGGTLHSLPGTTYVFPYAIAW